MEIHRKGEETTDGVPAVSSSDKNKVREDVGIAFHRFQDILIRYHEILGLSVLLALFEPCMPKCGSRHSASPGGGFHH